MNMNVLNKLDLKKKIIALNAIIILLIAGIVFYIIIPSVNDIKNMQTDIHDQFKELEKKYFKGQSLKKLSENLKTIDPQLEKLEGIFINESDEVAFVTFLENLAHEKMVKQKISLGTPEDFVEYKKIPMQINTEGNYLKQMDYLSSLESLNYYINVKSLEISPSMENGLEDSINKGNVNLSLNVDTYWKK